MFRMLFAMIRTVFFMVSVTAAFLAGVFVSNLDRLADLEAKLLQYKPFLPKKVLKVLPSQQLPYTRPAARMTLNGRVLEVYDGDTLTMAAGGRKFKVRLFGIDAPEAQQEYGLQARDRLRAMVSGKEVKAEILNVDRYGRGVGIVSCAGTAVNLEMVRSGCAWHYRQYAAGETALAAAEAEAKQAKRGLWDHPAPVPPWEYRKSMNPGKSRQPGKKFPAFSRKEKYHEISTLHHALS